MIDIRVIPGHPMYGVTRDGLVWSARGRDGLWKELALSTNGKWGYLKVKLTGGKTYKVHVLVALVFIGPRPEGMQVNHIDGCKANNADMNLEYCTRSENIKHAFDLELMVPNTLPVHPFVRIRGRQRKLIRAYNPRRGEDAVNHKLTDSQVVEIRQLFADRVPLRHIGRRFGVSATHVQRIGRGLKRVAVVV